MDVVQLRNDVNILTGELAHLEESRGAARDELVTLSNAVCFQSSKFQSRNVTFYFCPACRNRAFTSDDAMFHIRHLTDTANDDGIKLNPVNICNPSCVVL
jgi:hypothetical protein